MVFFEYGVVVFFGLSESEERDILEDIENAGIMKRKIQEGSWEIEECHYTVGSSNNLFLVPYSNVYLARPAYRVSAHLQRFLQ